jgi:sulfite reductase (ferredoxin)
VWIALDEVADVWEGVASIFRDYGYRRLRSRARRKFLVADWGIEKFREVLETEYLHRTLLDGPAPVEPPAGFRDHIGVHRQNDGTYYIGFAAMVGRLSGTLLNKVADLAEEHGSGRMRTTAEQKLLILDVPAGRTESLITALESLDLQARPTPFRRQTMACTGIEFCKLAIVDTKLRATRMIQELERRMPGFEVPLTVNLNGCPNACARFQVADIGLKGMLVTDDAGNTVEGYQVHLGGSLGLAAGFGRKVRGLKVTSADLEDYIERVLRRFLAQRQGEETFAAWTTRAAEADLS